MSKQEYEGIKGIPILGIDDETFQAISVSSEGYVLVKDLDKWLEGLQGTAGVFTDSETGNTYTINKIKG